ncbi:ABC transporter permease [Rhodopirellula sallentina]|uniref:Signal peptide protein n=1 Tax=Rhodopirellula sallentina SM41 TaxID=1263870 RepID=M5U998_9BACT|nr:ABC transporter permease [Rhodopirellula sallentina]EMI58005.1 signal peptide protein [Rhodopirellula sallentina SM41]
MNAVATVAPARLQMMWHLLWKDLRLLRSLALAAVVGPVLVAVLLCINHWMWSADSPEVDGAFGMLCFLPGLVVIGAAPTLVGTENEDRTMDWMRRLPVSWVDIVVSKIVAALLLLMLAVLWVVLVFACCSLFLDLELSGRGSGETTVGQFILGGAFFVYVYLVVLTCGFFTAFLIRNSLASAVAIIPAVVFWLVLLGLYSQRFLLEFRAGSGVDLQLIIWGHAFYYLLPLVVHACLIGSVFYLAKRRLTGPSDESWRLPFQSTDVRRVEVQLSYTGTPSVGRALLWQHFQQTRWLLMSVALVVGASLLFASGMNRFGDMHGVVSILLLGWLQLILGVSVFHGDMRQPRRYFFADRGVAPWLVWSTRMLGPVAVSALISVTWVFGSLILGFQWGYLDDWGAPLLVGYALCFLIGASTGQWVRRGTMAYYAAPAVAYFAGVLAAVAAVPMPELFETVGMLCFALAVAIASLVASTWHLCQLTMRGRERWALWGPAWGWISVPIVLIALVSISLRLLL